MQDLQTTDLVKVEARVSVRHEVNTLEGDLLPANVAFSSLGWVSVESKGAILTLILRERLGHGEQHL